MAPRNDAAPTAATGEVATMRSMLLAAFAILVAFAIAHWRLAFHWVGRRELLRGVPYRVRLSRQRGGRWTLRLGIVSSGRVHFCLKPETAVDRFFKEIGLAHEQQLGDRRFDDDLYVVSDDTRFTAALAATPGLERALVDLFRFPQAGIAVRRLRCRGRQLWIEGTNAGSAGKPDAEAVAAAVLPLLLQLGRALAAVSTGGGGRSSRFGRIALGLLGVATALAIYGGVRLLPLAAPGLPVLLHRFDPLPAALGLAVATMLLLGLGCLVLLGRTSRTHLLLIEAVLVGGAGAGATAFAELRDHAIEADRSAPAYLEVAVRGRYAERCGKGGSICRYLELDASPLGGRGTRRIKVDANTYHAFDGAARATVALHPGRLGYPWISAIEPERK
jgi:hypothetical protein